MSVNKEKVRELEERVRAEPAQKYRVEMIERWLEQNQPQPVVVGLTDEQVDKFATWYGLSTTEQRRLYCDLKKFLLTQTFALPQQLKPSWESAPDWANWLAQDKDNQWLWYEDKPYPKAGNWYQDRRSTLVKFKNWTQTLEQRPKPPEPQIEVGQVWRNLKNKENYTVKSLGLVKIGEEWQESVIYWLTACEINPTEFTRTLEDFLAKFERVV